MWNSYPRETTSVMAPVNWEHADYVGMVYPNTTFKDLAGGLGATVVLYLKCVQKYSIIISYFLGKQTFCKSELTQWNTNSKSMI